MAKVVIRSLPVSNRQGENYRPGAVYDLDALEAKGLVDANYADYWPDGEVHPAIETAVAPHQDVEKREAGSEASEENSSETDEDESADEKESDESKPARKWKTKKQ